MITSIQIQNCLSIVSKVVTLAPFTLLIGANGSGKTNFLRVLQAVSHNPRQPEIDPHINHIGQDQKAIFRTDIDTIYHAHINKNVSHQSSVPPEITDVRIFSINPELVGQPEGLTANPTVQENGAGVVQVLDALKTGDREDLFELIETNLSAYIPEIEKLSFLSDKNGKYLQVRERYIDKPLLVSALSEGTKFVIAFLTILYQEHPPSLICLEEIDRGLHPRLFEKVLGVCFDMAQRENMPQIIATTHNPYIVDQFKGREEAVMIVEKHQGETTFTSLAERLQSLTLEDDDPLGELWFSGFVGGVPSKGDEA